jgi:RNA polymerase sigma-70 factor (ECF subfamily)
MEQDLVQRAQRGDHEAFDALAGAAYDRLFALAFRILRDADRGQDAVQECLLHAWRDIRGLRDPDRFDAWLHRLLVNACFDESRRRRSRPAEVQLLRLDRPAPGDDVRALADRDELERAFRRLPVEQRAVVVMTHYLGMRAPEIAETLGVPVGTVNSRLHYAIRAMRAVLEADARLGVAAPKGRTA